MNIFDEMSDLISSSERLSSPTSTDPEANFILGGYSWIRKQFEIWTITHRPLERRFAAEPAKWLSYSAAARKVIIRKKRSGLGAIAGRIAFAGDQSKEAQRRLAEMLRTEDTLHAPIRLDMQPFQVVRDMLRDPSRSESIGGAPQLVKIYQYMKSAPLAVYWPKKRNGRPHLHGRPCLSYERIDRWTLDPDTLRSEQTLLTDDYELPAPDET